MSYQAFRDYGGPTFYPPAFIPWEADLQSSGLIFCFIILAVSFFIILPGFIGKEKLFNCIRITASMFIGAVILVTNFSQTWDTARVETATRYQAGSGQEVNVSIGVYIGFRGVNITLKGEKDQLPGEIINYNENFNWEGMQGRPGFGSFAGAYNKNFRAAQLRGVPLPILAVAEYFTLDGEGFRWGRYYRQAGWYSHIALWFAFPIWLLSNILFMTLLRYGAYFLSLTGLFMVTANIIWATMRNSGELVVHLGTQQVMRFSYGAAFWLCLVTGVVCVVLGIAVFVLDKLLPGLTAAFFGVDVLQDSENILIVDEVDQPSLEPAPSQGTEDSVDSKLMTTSAETEDRDEYDDESFYKIPPPPIAKVSNDPARPYSLKPPGSRRSFRSSEARLTSRLQRPRRRVPPPPPAVMNDEDWSSLDLEAEAAPTRRVGGTAAQRVTFGDSGSKSMSTEVLYENMEEANVTMTGFEQR